jgi:vanillate O-demethylase monooxygenase subunit
MVAWNLPLTQAQRDTLLETTLAGFQEDKDMLEAIQSLMGKAPRGLSYPEVMVGSDQPAVQARRQLKRRLDTEPSK